MTVRPPRRPALASPAVRTRPRRSILALVLAAALTLGACAGDGELGGPTLGGTLAAKVGSFEYTNADLEDEVENWASNGAFLSLLQINDLGAPGRRSAELVTFVLSHRIVSEQARQVAAASGYEPSEAEVDDILSQVDQSFVDPSTGAQVFTLFTDEFRRKLARDLAYQSQLQSFAGGTEVPVASVNPRYGEVNTDELGFAQVAPPEGPLPAPVPAFAPEG